MPDLIDALVTKVESLAQEAVDALKANPRVAEIQQKFADVKAALEAAKTDEPDEAPPA
jgi:phage tail protein X